MNAGALSQQFSQGPSAKRIVLLGAERCRVKLKTSDEVVEVRQ